MSGAVDELVHGLVARDELTGGTLSKPSTSAMAGYRKATIRPIDVRGERRYAWTAHFATRSETENLSAGEAERRLRELLTDGFRQALLHATDADYQVLGGTKVLRRAPTRPAASLEHDRRKRHLFPEGEPVPFLVELGVMNAEGAVHASRRDKFRQVNRFAELVNDVLPALPADGTLRVVDFGSGKSYLTFALHHLLHEVHGREVAIVGLDLKADVVERCAALASKLECEGLTFEVGDIAGYGPGQPPHLVVSLHACDTATDDALAQAVRWRAPVVLAVPCCHHELLGQIESEPLRPLLAHGLLRERLAADVTDAARAQLLRIVGYDVQLVELVAVEHTPKNLLIRAVRNERRDRRRAASEYVELKRALHIDPHLERALRGEIELDA
jgi:SAM-dependent methyltransferase